MFFQRLSLTNFGSFESAEFAFRPRVVNVIVGENGSGKSQLVGAIIAALIGRSALRIADEGIGPSLVDVSVREGDILEHLHLTITLNRGTDATVEQLSKSEDADRSMGALKLRLLTAWSNPTGPRLLLTGSTLAQSSNLSIDDFKSAIPDSLKRSREWWQLRESGIMQGASASGGEIALGVLLGELARRSQSRESLPLIVDDYLGHLAEAHVPVFAKLLETVAETSQVILLTHRQPTFGIGNLIYLKSRVASVQSLAYYNNLIEQQRPRLKPRARATWVRGSIFSLPESRTCELKEIKGGNPVSSIKSVVDQYVVAFLNAGYPQEGTILWGIRGEDRTITGVPLSDQDCDEMRRVVTEKLHQITPTLAPTAYRIELHRITGGVEVIPNLYVLEIRVPAARRTFLYATGSGDVYVKTDSGKRRLSPLEIQHELLNRVGIEVPI